MIKVWFEDFWGGVCAFNIFNNVFTRAISKIDTVQVTSKNPDIVIHHQFKRQGHLKYNCIKVGYIAENRRPDFNTHDYCISNDYNNNENHLRYPLWRHFVDEYSSIDNLINLKPDTNKKLFCAFIVSAAGKGIRDNFYLELSKYKKIDSYGKRFQNMPPDIIPQNGKTCWRQPKIDLLRDRGYKFVITFENNTVPGYCTEKLVDGLEAGTVPIYWGDANVSEDFNPLRFLNLHKFSSQESFIDKIIEIDNDEEHYKSFLKEPIFTKSQIKKHKEPILTDFFKKIINNKI